MSSEETVTFNLELNVEQAISEIRRLETLLFRSIALARRLGLPEDIDSAVYKIQRLIMVVRLAHSTLIAFQTASGPIGWALAIVGGLTAVASASDFMVSLGE